MNKEVIVEIGAISRPVFSWSENAREKISRGATYINIDRGNVGFVTKSGLGADIFGDLDCLPIASGVVDEVWLANVFTHGINRFENIGSQFQELSRVLKTQGKIFIVETTTPGAWVLEENFSGYGLHVEAAMKGSDLGNFIAKQRIIPSFEGELLSDYLSLKDVPLQPFVLVLNKASEAQPKSLRETFESVREEEFREIEEAWKGASFQIPDDDFMGEGWVRILGFEEMYMRYCMHQKGDITEEQKQLMFKHNLLLLEKLKSMGWQEPDESLFPNPQGIY